MKLFIIHVSFLPSSGMALFPFILLKYPQLKEDPQIINHECIHLRQQLELLILPFYIVYLLNYLLNLVYYRKHHDAYMNIVFEREAYSMEKDLNYLSTRKFCAWLHYF